MFFTAHPCFLFSRDKKASDNDSVVLEYNGVASTLYMGCGKG